NSGDWFNKLDFSYQDNNYGVGLPVAGKNQDNWPLMQPRLADPALKPDADAIMMSAALFQELLAMRDSSPLFRLQTEAEVQERVAFHNTGSAQLPGLIVMSISDLVGEDLDGEYGAIFVLVNANDEEQSFIIDDAKDRYIKLHPVQDESVDAVVKMSTFDRASGTFGVPGRTTAVFVLYDTPEGMIGDLIDQIKDLVEDGVLNAGQGNSLIVKLDQALKQLDDGKSKQAIKAMNAFINQVNSLYMEGVLPEETAAQLVKDAEFIIASIESGN
ncbi:MAG: DUF3372 domain-containing protein, partial [Anaerolineales bacterium]|nr:DUF3372 domain-containing protein [Anaerolineales bacterium]